MTAALQPGRYVLRTLTVAADLLTSRDDDSARGTLAMNRGEQRHFENAYLGTSRRREQV